MGVYISLKLSVAEAVGVDGTALGEFGKGQGPMEWNSEEHQHLRGRGRGKHGAVRDMSDPVEESIAKIKGDHAAI